MQAVQSFFNKLVPHNLAGDLSFLLLFLALCIGLGVYLGRSRLINVLIYGYVGVALIHVFPQAWFAFSPYGKAWMFLAILIFLFFVGDYLFDVHISSAGSDFFWRIMVMSFLTIGMVVSIVLTLLPRSAVAGYISNTAYGYFTLPLSQLLWMTIPLFFLLFINKRLR